MTAAELIAHGYRLYWVEVRKEVPVLMKPEEARAPMFDAPRWADNDGDEWESDARLMRAVSADTRDCLPHTTADTDGDPPTIGELLDAQNALEAT